MKTECLRRLNEIILDKFIQHVGEFRRTDDVGKVCESWRTICADLGIESVEYDDFLEEGLVLEELVLAVDPSPRGRWLEMTHDTALRILTLGMP